MQAYELQALLRRAEPLQNIEVCYESDLRPTDEHGVKRHGWEIGQMSKMICIAGVYPDRP